MPEKDNLSQAHHLIGNRHVIYEINKDIANDREVLTMHYV